MGELYLLSKGIQHWATEERRLIPGSLGLLNLGASSGALGDLAPNYGANTPASISLSPSDT